MNYECNGNGEHIAIIYGLQPCPLCASHVEVARMKSKTYCAYCGKEYALDTDGAIIAEHIATCEKHPMRAVETELAVMEKENKRLRIECESFNAARIVANQRSDELETALAEERRLNQRLRFDVEFHYFSSKAHRAAYEAAALAAELEVYYRLTGCMLDVHGLAEGLGWYKVGVKDIAVTAKHLAIVRDTLLKGGEVSDQMKVIAKVLS